MDDFAKVSRGFYRHWKGGVYFVSSIAVLDDGGAAVDDGTTLVIYESVQGCSVGGLGRSRARTIDDFFKLVADRDGHLVPRFTRIESWQ